MDNGSANATMLEVARLVSERRDQIHRGLRVIFWSGHSHGRYSGSTWYADHFWQELYDHCVAHVNVDSTGARGATYYGSIPAHPELGEFGARIVQRYTGQATRAMRMSRAGDMSFDGIGIPALYMEMSQVPVSETETNYVSLSLGQETGGKMPWWWHTSEDTIDKVDLDVLETDTRIYASAVWRLCENPLLPMDFRPTVDDIRDELVALQEAGAGHLDLSGVLEQSQELARAVAGLWEAGQRTRAPDEIESLNRRIKLLSRLLIPITRTLAGRFDHDPARSIPFLPGLADARRLPQMNAESDEYQFLLTQLVRNRNALAFALRQALDALGG
jgi:hypothetical protein